MRPFTVSVTGGVASGKSSACARFESLGVPVIDADVASRTLVAPGSPALREIRAAFGDGVFLPDGTLDRARMRERIFADDGERLQLEAILHPRVRELLYAQTIAQENPYVIVAIPLLAEVGRYDWLDRVLVIDVPEAVQIARLVQRDGVDEALARRMLAAQATREQRLAIADDVIENTADLAALHRAVDGLHPRYLALSAARKESTR
jgi:dephospho-CoA kinase